MGKVLFLTLLLTLLIQSSSELVYPRHGELYRQSNQIMLKILVSRHAEQIWTSSYLLVLWATEAGQSVGTTRLC